VLEKFDGCNMSCTKISFDNWRFPSADRRDFDNARRSSSSIKNWQRSRKMFDFRRSGIETRSLDGDVFGKAHSGRTEKPPYVAPRRARQTLLLPRR